MSSIQLRGVEVHNLKQVNADIPLQQFTVVCGVSGSGKTSLALDTLYAEGQRRYIESFSAYTRQFLARLPKPTAERIENIPPAIAVTHRHTGQLNRGTVGTATEVLDYLRLLITRIGITYCPSCDRRLQRVTVESAATALMRLPDRTKFMLAFPQVWSTQSAWQDWVTALRVDGFVRWIAQQRTWSVEQSAGELDAFWQQAATASELVVNVVVDRLVAGAADLRLRESLETILDRGGGRGVVYLPAAHLDDAARAFDVESSAFQTLLLDGQPWLRLPVSQHLECPQCQLELPKQDPRLFSFNSPMGACPACEGFGNRMDVDLELVVPDPSKSLRQGAIAPWNTPAYCHELEELLQLAEEYQVPVDIPFRDLSPATRQLIWNGVPERQFGGLAGFFAWLERRKYKMHIRVFLSRWRSFRTCDVCHGTRLRPESLATRIAGRNIAQLCALSVTELLLVLREACANETTGSAVKLLGEQIENRLRYLASVGLGYLTLDRSTRTLSAGESQRVSLTSALGSNLVNMLYVLDEPSLGLHAADKSQLLRAIESLRDRGNTVVAVEHDAALIRAADHVMELGPGAGDDGGRITFEGSPATLQQSSGVLTGDYLAGRRGRIFPEQRRAAEHGWIKLSGAAGNNLRQLAVEFPLGVLCVVTGVSGSGKSSLVSSTLYPALARRKGKEVEKPLPFDQVIGDGQLEDVVLIDQAAIGRSPRSNPVTYIKAFDGIRKLFAETLEARTRNLKPSHFSFNVDGGRCPACKGDGAINVDMQFLADVQMECSECQGKRYRREVLDILYRGKNIAEVLDMSVRRAHAFFRGQPKVQHRLQQMIEVGLDYLRLGQSAATLSAGEAQRLKLAGYLLAPRKGRTLFIMDEPTAGLHFADVVQLLDCFDSLLEMGHSLIVVEHHLQVIRSADYLIDLGPGAADQGGEVLVVGSPDQVAQHPDSPTGRVLNQSVATENGQAH